MNREIYRRTVAPHNARVAADSGTPPDNIQAAILLARDNQEWIGLDKYLCISPELFGYKTRTSAPYNYATKVYSANSPQRELGDNKVVNGTGLSTTGWTTWTPLLTLVDSKLRLLSEGSSPRIYQTITCEIGKVYSISGKKWNGTNTSSGVVIGITAGSVTGALYNNNSSQDSVFSSTFTATQTTHYLMLYVTSPGTGSYSDFDDLEIREILNADLTQTTANSQPYLSKIAPSEPQSLLNTNGDSRYLLHSAISFAANEKWTAEIMINLKGSASVSRMFCGNTSNTRIGYAATTHRFRLGNNTGDAVNASTANVRAYIGKTAILHFVAAGNGTVKIYGNGIFLETISLVSNFTFSEYFRGDGSYIDANGYHYSIIPDALSADRISYRAALLRSIFPEIPTVNIAGLNVAVRALDIVCTPAGNLIPNVTDSTAWAALTTPAWCHHSNDLAYGSTYNKLYNGYARTALKNDLLSSSYGYHIATEAELTALMASGVALKEMGTSHWTTANGTNVTGMTLLGGASRSTDGTFATIKGSVMFWCGDSDKCLTLLDDGTISIDAKDLKTGAYILLVKN